MSSAVTLKKGLHDWRTVTGKHGDLLRAQAPLLSASGIALAFEIAFALLAPWPVKFIFDGLLIPENADTLPLINPEWTAQQPIQFLGFVSLAVLLISVGQGIAGYIRTVTSAVAGQRMIMKLRKRVYSHLLLLSLKFHRDQKLGDLLVRITGDVPMLRDVLSTELIDFAGTTFPDASYAFFGSITSYDDPDHSFLRIMTGNSGDATRRGLFCMATCYTFLFVGALFGWGPMEGAYLSY